MPGSTPRGYPFPLAGEAPAGNTNMSDLAFAIDSDMSGNDGRFVNTSGDTMTGQLNTIAPTAGGNAVNKTYADSLWRGYAMGSIAPFTLPHVTATVVPLPGPDADGIHITDNKIVFDRLGWWIITVALDFEGLVPGGFRAFVMMSQEGLARIASRFSVGWGERMVAGTAIFNSGYSSSSPVLFHAYQDANAAGVTVSGDWHAKYVSPVG